MVSQLSDVRSRQSYPFDVERAARAVEKVNSSRTFLAGDRLMHRSFGTIRDCFARDSIAENVVLLDAVWRTNLSMQPGTSEQIVASLEKQADCLTGLLESLRVDDLERRPETVVGVARKAQPVILPPTSEQGKPFRENYSFATKFFHWVTRHHFPIVDSRARKSINALQRAVHASPVVRASTAEWGRLCYVEEYGRWVRFYSDLIAGLGGPDRERLLKADYDSQLGWLTAVENSLLRVLDKVLWSQGGGSA